MIVVLNGGSSSGKSTIARHLTGLLGASWLRFSIDDFVASLSPAIEDSPEGLVIDEDGDVRPGRQFRALEIAWHRGLFAMSQAGANVVLDDVLLDGGVTQERMRQGLGGDLIWVGVRCDPDVAAAREAARGDRQRGMARKQAETVHEGVEYDVVVDTSCATPAGCAHAIAQFVHAHGDGRLTSRRRRPGRG